jgi:hypothetical protein
MNSPFLFQNTVVLLLLISVFAVSLYLLLSKNIGDYICNRSKILLVLYRAATSVVLSASLIVLLSGIWLFYIIEINDVSRDCWKRSYQWHTIVPGMQYAQAAEIMGNPSGTLKYQNGEQSVYCISPINGLDSGTIIFSRNPNEPELKILSKTPDDQTVLENLRVWIPDKSSKTYANYAEIISDSSAFCAFYGLLGLAVLTFYPFKMSELSTLRMLYAPLAALVLKAIYDSHQTSVWDFELFSAAPLFTIIIIGWIVRLSIILGSD